MESSSNQVLLLAVVDIVDRVERRATAALSNIKGISLAEYRILRALELAPARQASRVALADMVGLTASGVTRALAPLEKIGYVKTVRDERDARKALATLTDAGVELVADASGVVDDITAHVVIEPTMEQAVMAALRQFATDSTH